MILHPSMRRKKPMPRNTKPIQRKTPLPKSTKVWGRSAKIKVRKRNAADSRRIYGSKERVRWVKASACVCCEAVTGRNHNHHVIPGGAGFKANADKIVSVCPPCHHLIHTGELGRTREWWLDQARLTEERWQNGGALPFMEAEWDD
jgi:hypothetical protein